MWPSSLNEYVAGLERTFSPEKTEGAHAVLQYVFSGRVPGACYAEIADGTLRTGEGYHPAPTVTVRADFDLWQRIITYRMDGLLAYQNGEYAVEGDVETLMLSDTWFVR